jgi:hypothetical protein
VVAEEANQEILEEQAEQEALVLSILAVLVVLKHQIMVEAVEVLDT